MKIIKRFIFAWNYAFMTKKWKSFEHYMKINNQDNK